jgi:hypothetical protein
VKRIVPISLRSSDRQRARLRLSPPAARRRTAAWPKPPPARWRRRWLLRRFFSRTGARSAVPFTAMNSGYPLRYSCFSTTSSTNLRSIAAAAALVPLAFGSNYGFRCQLKYSFCDCAQNDKSMHKSLAEYLPWDDNAGFFSSPGLSPLSLMAAYRSMVFLPEVVSRIL